ncbi:T9SS sorting signal type C domain-containing protein [Flavobacterium sp. B183]|uniref:T9SS sorting signal type C domain-containing protein n=1 Tax=Flavobacterium sp. B183 TaxID=907046 RepID=UPI00201F3187|nr:T9SS sorting signal type C domain-containing protein [Flavobacterium sp. B183]URC13507.1 T9SS sorting signal type C domain-containing protein [Flavobacterium sp. B183]
MNRKLLLSFVLFFTYLINYGQCNFGGTQFGSTTSICYNREVSTPNVGGVTFSAVPVGRYVSVNVIQGLTYTISATTNSTGFIKRITLFNGSNTSSYIGSAVAGGNNSAATLTNWQATFTGILHVRYTNDSNCSTTSGTASDVSVIFTGGSNSVDSQTAQGTNSWIGHVYDFSNGSEVPVPPSNADAFANYLGSFTQANTITGSTTAFSQGFGGNDVCFAFTAGGTSQSVRTDTFAIRYRMRSTLAAGCYFVGITGDDGVRLYIDGVLVLNEWSQQSSAAFQNVLVRLTGNSDLVLEYYEKNGGNVSNFTITPADGSANTVTPATSAVCGGSTTTLDGSNYAYNGGTTNPSIRFQWQFSSSASGPWTDATTGTGFNAEDYTPAAITPSVATTVYYRRKVSAASNAACSYDSSPVSITTNPRATITNMSANACSGSPFSVIPVDGTNGLVPAGTTYTWSAPTGPATVSGRAASSGNPTSITGTLTTTAATTQNVIYNITATTGSCTSTFQLTVTVYPTIGGTVTGDSTVCAGTNSTIFNLTGNTGSVVRWESSTDNFTSVITPIANTTTSLTATNVNVTTSYRAVVQNMSCPLVASSAGTVTIKNPVATGVTICQGGTGSLMSSATCAAVAQTPMTASNGGGTSNTTSYTGSGNVGFTINFPALPAGAVVTATNLSINFTANSPSYRNELLVRVTPPVAVGAAQTDLQPSTAGTAGSVTNASLGTWGTGNPSGNWTFAFKESLDDNSINPDANITNITITVNYTLPATIDWYTVASGGTKIGSGASFNPVGIDSRLMNTNTVGTTPYYVACSGDPACRTMVNFVINEIPAAPVTVTVTQPTCTVPSGSIALSGLPSGGTLTRSPGAVVVPYSGTTATDTNLAEGNYTYTVANATCTSTATTGTTINMPPVVATYSSGGWSSPPAIDKILVFASDYTSGGDINGCSCTVNSGVNVVISSGNTLKVTNSVTTNGQLTFKNTAALVQTNNVTNTGDITYERTTPPILLKDYVYWSTPVSPQRLVDLSSLTPSTMYYGFDGTQWVRTPRTDNMVVGKGYIIRAPSNYSNSSKTAYPASFKGVPNNGNIETEMLASGKSYLIGNPYPSALSGERFVSEGIEGFIKTNENVINGTLYFWTHNTPAKPVASNQYSADDYASFNLTGGTAARSDVDYGSGGGVKPTGEIAAGQSFFLTTKAAGKILFTNAMRLGAVDNGQFFRPANTSRKTTIEKNRIWLNMTSTTGAFKQLLLGYIEGATNNYETLYDGLTLDGNQYLDFYSVSDANKFVIQARALPFTDADIVPLGYRTAVAGDFTIAIDEVDGKMTNQKIYVEDKATGVIHDLTQSNYTFKTEIGNFTERLVLRYTDKTLGVGDFENLKDGILVSIKDKVIAVQSSQENIKEVTVYDVSGKMLYNKKKVGNTELQIQNLPSSNQVLLVKVTLANDFTTTRKVIFQ